MRLNKDVLLVVAATAGLSLKGIWARLCYAEGLDVAGVLFYRAVLATPLFLALGGWLLRRGARAGTGHQVTAGAGIWAIATGLGGMFSVGMYSDFQAISFLGAGVSRVILFGFPLVVMVIESIIKRQRPATNKLAGFAIAWVGLVFVAGGNVQIGATDWRTGLLWAFASLLLYGLFVASSVPLSRALGSVRLTMVANTATGVAVIGVLLTKSGGVAPSASIEALGWVGMMIVISTVAPYFMLTEGIRRLGGSQAGLIAMLGPPLTVGAGWLTLGETLSTVQLLGTVAVLGGVLLSQRSSGQAGVERVPARTSLAPSMTAAER